MNPSLSARAVIRIALIVIAVLTAAVAISYRTPLSVAIGMTLAIAALAAAPREVGAYVLIALNRVFNAFGDILLNAAHLCAVCAMQLCPDLVKNFNYVETGKAQEAQLSVGRYSVHIWTDNFNMSHGLLAEMARRVFAGCAEFDEKGFAVKPANEPADREYAVPLQRAAAS